ncbi:hypothetical protein N7499_001814 [Penicillium canescens]|nr:hypothetical protein N7522_007546 [Penicillium canescens]KAJ6097440.1 hypothetical protein N7499_001814 [Penicillium canescens]KAJ6165429.1 hypothetical protein N7485_008673 [Penicillium canescens]
MLIYVDLLTLADRLDRLPLAIVIAGSTCITTKNLGLSYSCNRILEDLNVVDLLLLLARFDNRDIWYELVKSGRHSSNVPD